RAPMGRVRWPPALDAGEDVRVRLECSRGNARLENPLIERDRVRQLAANKFEELRRRNAAEGEVVEVAAEKRVEALPTDSVFDSAEHERALFIGDQRDAIVGIAARQIDMQNAIGFG